ncbi:hypothetical protein AX14_008954 [Amanita brunnescens Koide BX004]|nr:hypothetical protein AX14_008954 [Amanita brunnescens Koide BX004]
MPEIPSSLQVVILAIIYVPVVEALFFGSGCGEATARLVSSPPDSALKWLFTNEKSGRAQQACTKAILPQSTIYRYQRSLLEARSHPRWGLQMLYMSARRQTP